MFDDDGGDDDDDLLMGELFEQRVHKQSACMAKKVAATFPQEPNQCVAPHITFFMKRRG